MRKGFRTVKTAAVAIRRNSLRAFLTALGIIIGIAAVIVMMEIGQGSRSAIQKTILAMGSNTILVMPGTAASGGVSFGAGSGTSLTESDALAILKESSAVSTVAPLVRTRTQVVYGSRNWVPHYIYGTTPAYLDVRNWTTFSKGESFTDRDVRNGSKVAVIGQTIARELFQGEDPIGKEIRIQNISFRVIGVLSLKGANMMGMDQDDIVLAPWTTIKNRVSSTSGGQSTLSTTQQSSAQQSSNSALYPGGSTSFYPDSSQNSPFLNRRIANIDQIQVAARSPEDIKDALAQIKGILRERHKLREGEPDDFTHRDMSEMTSAFSSTNDVMSQLLLGVACISLVVGGIGIMNIMLVSVTERTREIGLRMAVGARERDILRQFLTEAVILCLSGGIIGIILGRTISLLVRNLLNWTTEASPIAVLAAFVVSVGVGLIFGYYPAAKAAKLDPIEALRRE